MSQSAFAWTAFPPLPLRGVGTEHVESYEYYFLHMSWRTGWSPRQLASVIEAAAHTDGDPLPPSFYLMDERRDSQIRTVERLTGNPDLKHGTLWALKDVLNMRGLYGGMGAGRRWCPVCYKDWDPNESWEPLLWSIPYVSRCPTHGCDLLCGCPSCGATQRRNTPIDSRRRCQKCGEGLGGSGSAPERPKFYDWIDGSLLDLIKVCATPGQEPFAADTLSRFAEDVESHARFRRELKKVRKCLGLQPGEAIGRAPSLAALLNLSAMLGTSVVDLLNRPGEVICAPLLDIWSGFHWLCDPFAKKDDPVRVARWLLKKLLGRGKQWYLPSIGVVTKDLQVCPSRLKAFDPETHETYMDAYAHQCSSSGLYSRGVAFAAARDVIKGTSPHMCSHQRMWWLPREIKKRTHVSLDDASEACAGAVVYSKLLVQAVRHASGAIAAKDDIRWIESAS